MWAWLSARLNADVLARLSAVQRQLTSLERLLMATLDDLQNAVDRNGQAVASAVTGITDLRSKVAQLQQAVDAGTLDTDRLAAITASIDASTDAVAQALAPVVDDPATPTGGVDTPPEQNPDTVDPGTVDGSVDAGEPLPQ